MNVYPVLLLVLSLAVTFAEKEVKLNIYIFPAFDKEDVASAITAFPNYSNYEYVKALSAIDLRSIMTFGNFSDQDQAAAELIARGDQKTILRLVYSLKQGNDVAESLLRRHDSLATLPYLIEDVANGSIEPYVDHSPGDDTGIVGRVRSVATGVVAETLANSPEITGATRDCLRSISIGSNGGIESLSEKSRYLIQWWLLNENALNAGKWQEMRPLPQEIRFPSDDTAFPPDIPADPELETARKSHILGPQWELSESFEAWSARIVDPKRRNLDFVALSWDGKKVVEHPAKSLDVNSNPQDREARKTPAPRKIPTSADDSAGNWGLGIVFAVLTVIYAIVRWIRRKASAGN